MWMSIGDIDNKAEFEDIYELITKLIPKYMN